MFNSYLKYQIASAIILTLYWQWQGSAQLSVILCCLVCLFAVHTSYNIYIQTLGLADVNFCNGCFMSTGLLSEYQFVKNWFAEYHLIAS